jgi:2-polyprenyl-6-methoxyphenol hydroxylase-like FAD-dependent oxidoreductase
MDVAVIGLGTAGSAAAALLARDGHSVSLFERAPDPGPVGAGIVLQPLGAGVLRRLGVADEVIARGAPLVGLTVVDGARRLMRLRYADLDPAFAGHGMHRGVLFQELLVAVREAGVALHTGVEVRELPRGRRGRWLLDSQGRQHGPFQLVVVADGARSRLAAQIGASHRRVAYPYGALWFVGADSQFRGELHQHVDGARHMTGFLPTGLGPSGQTPLVSVFDSLRVDRLPAWKAEGLDAWKARLLAIEPRAEPLLAQIRSQDDVLFASYHDVTMWPWDDGDAVVLGDAAHAMSPQLGHGANLALADAACLADCLREHADTSEALDAYSRRRAAHLAYFQFATRWLTPFFQSDSRLLGVLRDLVFPIVQHLPPARDLMLASMVGHAAGFFARVPLESPAP